MLEMIRNLNNEAVFLSNQCNDAIKAIEYLQQALIICKDLEMSLLKNSNPLNQYQNITVKNSA